MGRIVGAMLVISLGFIVGCVRTPAPTGLHAAEIENLSRFLSDDGRQIFLQNTSVGDQAMLLLHDPVFSNLEVLNLQYTRVTDEGISYLRGLPIKAISLHGTKITDAGLIHLQELPVDMVVISGTAVTKEGAERLSRELPEALVIY
ncbi:MAG: hypothetical protein KDD44_13770 [Bdellovibrionales bacterium]|nr:hypothetical protein [Bdellovibrionales bacterium]